MDNFQKLHDTKHMLEWLSEEPYRDIRETMQNALQQQVPDSELVMLHVVSEPLWLTSVRPYEEDESQSVLVKTAVAFEVMLVVKEPNDVSQQLQGVYSWVGINLDDPENTMQQIWFDLDDNLDKETTQTQLIEKIYYLEQDSDMNN